LRSWLFGFVLFLEALLTRVRLRLLAKGRTATADPYGMTTKEEAKEQPKKQTKRTNENNQRKERARKQIVERRMT
jgi:hypothetical protein